MPSRFSERQVKLNTSLDREFAKAFEFRPMSQTDVNARTSADPSRSVRPVVGRLLEKHASVSGPGDRMQRRGAFHDVAAATLTEPNVSIADTQFAEDEMPRRNDHLMCADTGEVYQIRDWEVTGQGRRTYMLALIEKGPEV